MSKCRNKKRKGFYFLGVLMLVLAFCIPVSAGIQEGEGEYEVYPTPHSVDYEETATTALTDQVDVTCDSSIDQYTKKRITDTLDVLGLKESTAQAASNTKLNVAVYRSGETYDAQIGASEFLKVHLKNWKAIKDLISIYYIFPMVQLPFWDKIRTRHTGA